MGTESPLRVAHIITQLELGGAQRNTLYTVTHLNREHFEPCLMTGPGGILDDEAKGTGVPVFLIPKLVRSIQPIKDLRAMIYLYRLIRHLQPDIVHTHSSKAGILGRIAAYFAGVPILIHTFHGFGFTPTQESLWRRILISVERLCARLTTHLIFVSEENRQCAQTLKIGTGKPSSLIRSGIVMNSANGGNVFDGAEKRNSKRTMLEKLKIPDRSWVVSYVGNFKPQKNTLDLARVAEQVCLQAPDVHFILVGDGEQRDKVRKQIQDHQLQDRIHLLGWLKRRDDIQEVLGFTNCFVMTSLWEGLPRALVEAFAAGLPAVAYAVNGVNDILKDGETGFPIPVGDVEQTAQKILWLKANPEKAKDMGERARRLVQKEFDIDVMVRQQEALYEKLFNDIPLKDYYKPHGSLNPS